jgi:hypothetical protein
VVSRPKRLHVPNAVYHVTQRSTDREVFFIDDADFATFCELLELAAIRGAVEAARFLPDDKSRASPDSDA